MNILRYAIISKTNDKYMVTIKLDDGTTHGVSQEEVQEAIDKLEEVAKTRKDAKLQEAQEQIETLKVEVEAKEEELSTLKAQFREFKPGESYIKGETIIHDGKVYQLVNDVEEAEIEPANDDSFEEPKPIKGAAATF